MVHNDPSQKQAERLKGPEGAAQDSILGFSHLYVEVTNLDRSEKFYNEVLGLDIIGRGLLNEIGPNSTLAMNTRHRLVLVQVPEVEPFRPNSSSIHHAWRLTPAQFDRAQERFKAMGYEIDDNRAQFRAVGERSMDIFDPDGHRYQVQSMSGEATRIIIDNVGPIKCGNVADYEVGAVKPFVKGKFFVLRMEEGFIAYSRWCTHRNGLVTWNAKHWHFRCPMHGAIYDRKGENLSFCMDVPPLRQIPLEIADDGTITAHPDDVIVRETFDPTQLTRVDDPVG